MSPEQLGEFLALIQSGGLHDLLSGKTQVAAESSSDAMTDDNDDFYDEEEDVNDED